MKNQLNKLYTCMYSVHYIPIQQRCFFSSVVCFFGISIAWIQIIFFNIGIIAFNMDYLPTLESFVLEPISKYRLLLIVLVYTNVMLHFTNNEMMGITWFFEVFEIVTSFISKIWFTNYSDKNSKLLRDANIFHNVIYWLNFYLFNR